MYENAAVAWKVFGRYCAPQERTRGKKAMMNEPPWQEERFHADSLFVVTLEIVAYIRINTSRLMRDVWYERCVNYIQYIRTGKKKIRERERTMKTVIDVAADFMRLRSWMASIFIYPLYSCLHVISVSSAYTCIFHDDVNFYMTLTVFRIRVFVTLHSRFAVFRVHRKYLKAETHSCVINIKA